MELKEDVLAHFETMSKAFDEAYDGGEDSLLYKLVDILFRRQILERRKEIMIQASGEVKNKRVLDIGCGPGRYAIALAARKAQSVLGIDISASMIELAREKAKLQGLDEICKFQNLDFLDTDFPDKFDIIIAAGVFDYLKQPEIFLSKIHDVLEGRAIISFPIKWTLMTPLRIAWLAKRKCPNFYYTKGQIKRLLNSFGFKIISIDRIGTILVPGNYVVVCTRR